MLTLMSDQDHVIAELEKKWASVYNNEWNDNFTLDKWTGWNVGELVKPECGVKMYDIIRRPGFYADLEVVPYAQKVFKLLSKYFNVGVASASPKQAFTDKYEWIKTNFPFINPENILFVKNKSLVNANILIDDGVHNLEAFKGEIKILYDAPWNRDENRFIRVRDWVDIYILFTICLKNHMNDISEGYYNDNLILSGMRQSLSNVQVVNAEIKVLREPALLSLFVDTLNNELEDLTNNKVNIKSIKIKDRRLTNLFMRVKAICGVYKELSSIPSYETIDVISFYSRTSMTIPIIIDESIPEMFKIEIGD